MKPTKSESYDFHIKTEFDDVIVTMFVREGKQDKFVCCARARGVNDVALGIAQAASWALKKIYQRLEERENGGKNNGKRTWFDR